MKKLNFNLGLGVLGLAMFFTSCSKDNAIGPSIEVTSDVEVVAPANSLITISWRANAGDANLKTFTIKEGNAAIVDEDGINWNAFEIPSANNEAYIGSARVAIGTTATSFELIATDKDGLTASKTINVTIEQATGNPINSYTAILMGGQGNTTVGSYLDADAGQVYLKAAAITNQALIDVVYYYGTTNLATLCAPNDATVNGGSGNLTLCEDFTTIKNATKFGTSTITGAQFTAMTDDVLLSAITGLSATKMSSVAVGSFISFETAGGKKGVIKVANITTGSTGTITLEVKVQK
jgi:hypothetical protein